MDIRMEIALERKKRIGIEGYGLKAIVPDRREVPLVPFYSDTFVICEIKRGSPSKGKFASGLNAVEQAGHYSKSGVTHVSILTEEDRFYGSLNDLMDVKKKFPGLSVIRKDFLLDLTDVEVSYRCGADSILLIASLLDKERLVSMYNRSMELGMTPLVELHDKDDVNKVRDLKPILTGINSRNLKNFTIDPLRPLKIRSFIDWETKVIYESGIKEEDDGKFARDCGFNGVLVGEMAVKKAGLAKELVELYKAKSEKSPWERLFQNYREDKPFIKICGLTNRKDYDKVRALGADIIGFILAKSPREVDIQFVRSLGKDNGVLRSGVVVLKENEELSREVISLVEDGYLDFIQFHGDETPEKCKSYGLPYYKAIRIKDMDSIDTLGSYSKADLIDSFSESAYGGTGKVIDPDLTREAGKKSNLWLAGGLNPENVKSIVSDFNPDLVDVSSGVEASPGFKDESKLKDFFMELK